MFASVFDAGTVTAGTFFAVLAVSLGCGIVFAFLSCFRTKSSRSFLIATALLPMAVAMVIALVNGNIGIGVAIAGAFSLVRFRSAPGTARDITVIFIAMAAGLAFGMGYLAYGGIFLLSSGLLLLGANLLSPLFAKPVQTEKTLRVTIPEALDYPAVFEDIFAAFTAKCELLSVKTVNMGSMFRLTYRIVLRHPSEEKQLIDAIRTRNGNLEIQCARTDFAESDL